MSIRQQVDFNVRNSPSQSDSWSPELTATTTSPNLGTTGTSAGHYWWNDRHVHATADFVWNGTGISRGSGAWHVSLPFDADGPYEGGDVLGYGDFVLAGSRRLVVAYYYSALIVRLIDSGTGTVSNANPVGTIAAADSLRITLNYFAIQRP